jgi:hypothetical protein
MAIVYNMVKIISFSMSGICHGQNRPFWHDWNVSFQVQFRARGKFMQHM